MALAARPIMIYALRLSQPDPDAPLLDISVRCASGTYIRSLARDIGEALGCGGHLSMLRRTCVGEFRLEDALTLEQADAEAARGALLARLIPMDRALADRPAVTLDVEQTRRVLLGQAIARGDIRMQADALTGVVRVYDPAGRFIAVGRIEDGLLKPSKVFADA